MLKLSKNLQMQFCVLTHFVEELSLETLLILKCKFSIFLVGIHRCNMIRNRTAVDVVLKKINKK